MDRVVRKKPDGMPKDHLRAVTEEFAPRLYGFLLYRLGNRDDAQDLAQEAYLRLLRVEKTRFIQSPESYLFRIASNLANEFAMQQRRAPAMVELDTVAETGDIGSDDRFERTLEYRAFIRRLKTVLDDLPPAYRAAFLLSKRDGLSRQEIAAELGLSIHTVKKYLARAAAHCRANMMAQRP